MRRYFPRRFRPGLILAAAATVAGGWMLLAQMTPDAPIEHFRLPMFGENGYKSWELRGTRGHYLSEAEAMIEGLELVVYSGDEELKEDNIIRSPRALIHLDESTAEGDSSLFVIGPGYEIQGRNWTWSERERKIVVRENVRVSFAGNIDILD